MQARSGALDELLADGTLTDLTATPTDDIQAQLDAASTNSSIDAQLASLRAQIAGPETAGALEASPESSEEQEEQEEQHG
jgi:phage shock protein A